MNTDKTYSNLQKTNNSFNFNLKIKQFDISETTASANTLTKNHLLNNVKKQETSKLILNHNNNNKLTPSFKGILDDKFKILNKSNNLNNNPK